eukprot:7380784-Prymnesium_polylepis.3
MGAHARELVPEDVCSGERRSHTVQSANASSVSSSATAVQCARGCDKSSVRELASPAGTTARLCDEMSCKVKASKSKVARVRGSPLLVTSWKRCRAALSSGDPSSSLLDANESQPRGHVHFITGGISIEGFRELCRRGAESEQHFGYLSPVEQRLTTTGCRSQPHWKRMALFAIHKGLESRLCVLEAHFTARIRMSQHRPDLIRSAQES